MNNKVTNAVSSYFKIQVYKIALRPMIAKPISEMQKILFYLMKIMD